MTVSVENAQKIYEFGNRLMNSWEADLDEIQFELEKGYGGALFANLENDIQVAAHYRLCSSGVYLSLVVKQGDRFLTEAEARKALGIEKKEAGGGTGSFTGS
ncbi:hypothetical protein D6779_04510 [Candidatus Parcubacteria bacterium]|nr:MAG: hypothetical protein D6779_04510 [Candidatus Parcubacteria bacterium]